MVKRVWSEQEEKDIIEMFLNGSSFETISNKYNAHFLTIKKLLVSKGIDTSKKRRWKQEQIDDIVYKYTKESWTRQDLINLYSTNGREITKILKDSGVDTTYNRGRKTNRNVNNNYFKTIDTEQKAYILGMLTADGCVRYSKHGTLYMSLQLIDIDIIKNIKNELNSDSKIHVSKRDRSHIKNEKPIYSFTIYSNELCNDLISYGVAPQKTKNVDWLPNNIPDNLKRHYLRGLIDGDGSIYKMKDGRWAITLTNNHYNLLYEYSLWIEELTGIPPNKVSNTSTSKRVIYTGSKAIKIIKALYENNNISLDRKQKLGDQAIKDIV